MSKSSSNTPEKLFELAKLYCDRGDYLQALPSLNEAAQSFLEDKNYDQYLKCLQYTLRIHAERGEQDKITEIKENLHDLVIREGITLNSRTYYVLGLCSSMKGQPENAIEYLKKSLQMALEKDAKEDMCYAILGLSLCYLQQKKYEEALKEIYNLNIFLQVIDKPELKIAALNANALVFMEMTRYEQALEILWLAYEQVKKTKQLNALIVCLSNLGICLFETGQKDSARIYLNLAHKTIDPSNNLHILKTVNRYLAQLQINPSDDYDLMFDANKHAILEKNIGNIDFKNQFILLDLLKLFISHQGQIFSKEYLVKYVWKQEYEPDIHDNKIYVTIKRLRKMIEPDYDKPKYIFRAKNGYYLNKSAKVNIKEISTEGGL